jgi:diguanylate cyclase (GGDEF)-like protein
MDEGLDVMADPAELLAEISRLRGEVARLSRRVEELDELAHQDPLIALPNRRGFMRELERLIDRVKRYDATAAMLYIDLDGLKMINDSFGHPAGDTALIEVAALLSKGVRRSDVVARIGGDEFGILLESCDPERAGETARRLTELIGDSGFDYDGDNLPLSVAIGITMIGAGDSAAEVMGRADEEMYRAKAA